MVSKRKRAEEDAAEKRPREAGLSDPLAIPLLHFPVVDPWPDVLQDEDLIPASDVTMEQDLLLNLTNARSWKAYIEHIITSNRPSASQPHYTTADSHLSAAQRRLLGPLAAASNRLGLRSITFIYERAIQAIPYDYALWKDYLLLRMQYVLGQPQGGLDAFWKTQIRLGKEKLEAGPTLLDGQDEGAEEWQWGTATGALGPLDGRIGHREWHALAALFERALMQLPQMPRLWLLYFTMLMHPACPPSLSYTHTRRTFDRALRTLPPSLHLRVWKYYLRWAETRGSETCLRVWRRYLRVDPSLTERYVQVLERLHEEEENEEEEDQQGQVASLREQRAREAVKLVLSLAIDAMEGRYVSPEGKGPYQLLVEWLDLCERYADDVGLTPEEDAATPSDPFRLSAAQLAPLDPTRLPVGQIVRHLGLAKYPDQAGRLWTGLATYWIRRGDLDAAKATFEAGMTTVVTMKDFTQIFDAYAESSENVISYLMDELAETEETGDAQDESDLDVRMREFERLMERRAFLVNDVMIRRNPNDVQVWDRRVTLCGEDTVKAIATFEEAISTINPRKASEHFHRLFVRYARLLEGHTDRTDHLEEARNVLERATTVAFPLVDDLAEVWSEWAEMEVRNGNFDGALRILSRATAAPKTAAAIKAVSYLDDTLPAQRRLFKSSKLWSFYIDLEEAIGTVESARQTYDRTMELKIATPQVVVNYARFLEDRQYFEEAFRVYERGVEVFTYPVAFEIWNIYLSKFIQRYGASKLERARDLFEQALEKCPDKYCRPLFLMYGKLEEDFGLAKRAMSIYQRATERVLPADRFDLYVFYIAKVATNLGLPATRPVYERAIESLPDRQTADMCIRYAQLERKLGELDRARALYAHASQFCDPRTHKTFWQVWNDFEVEHGTEQTFREMLRIRRSVQAQFNTDASYISAFATAQARAAAQQQATAATTEVASTVDGEANQMQDGAMAQVAQQRNGGALPMFVAATRQTENGVGAVNAEKLGGGTAGPDGEGQDDDDDLM